MRRPIRIVFLDSSQADHCIDVAQNAIRYDGAGLLHLVDVHFTFNDITEGVDERIGRLIPRFFSPLDLFVMVYTAALRGAVFDWDRLAAFTSAGTSRPSLRRSGHQPDRST